MKIDHLVVAYDNTDIYDLEEKSKREKLPFIPKKGKKAKGFEISNLWIGETYLEIFNLTNKNGGLWKKEWIDFYNLGNRGLCALCIKTNNLDDLKTEFENVGIICEIKRIELKYLFGFIKIKMPWRDMFVGKIPGTNIELFFSELDNENVLDDYKPLMVPNTREVGINSIKEVVINTKISLELINFIKKIFSNVSETEKEISVDLNEGKIVFSEKEKNTKLILDSRSHKKIEAKNLIFEF